MLFNLFKKKKDFEPTSPFTSIYSKLGVEQNPKQTSTNKPSPYTTNMVNSLSAGQGIPSITGAKMNFSQPSPLQDVYSKLGVQKQPTAPAPTPTPTPTPAPQQQSSKPSYIAGYENLAEQKKKMLGDQRSSQEDYLNKYYGTAGQANQQNIDALNRNLAQNKASYEKSLAMNQARTDTKKQNVEDVWGEGQRQAAMTRKESEGRTRNKFAALGTTDSWGAGSYGQAQENVESDFNRYTQQGLRAKQEDLQELDFALQEYELQSQAKLDDLEMQVTQALNQIAQNQALSEIEKANAIKELGFAYEDAKMQVEEGLQGKYQEYYDKLAASEASELDFDDNGQPLNQASYEWMLKNPDEYKAAFASTDNQSANKVRGIIEQLAPMKTKGFTGLLRIPLSDEARNAEGLVKQLSSELQLEEAKRMKGQGTMTESERAILANSISAMNPDKNGRPRVSDDRFKQILDELYQQFGGSGSTQPSLSSFEG